MQPDARAAVPQELDPRARYYRFSVRVWSRYAPLLPENKRFLSMSHPEPEKGWRRLYIPCRVADTLPVPKVKLILLLTDSVPLSILEGDAGKEEQLTHGSAGLLVVLDEPWYQFGGIGEHLEAEVAQVTETRTDEANRKVDYFQIGPDPILGLPELDADGSQYQSQKYDVSFPELRGPVGHTHDLNDEGALFTATSFIIRPPDRELRRGQSGPMPANDLAWFMAKIRLRRVVHLSGGNSSFPPPNCPEDCGPLDRMQWVQFVPSFSLEPHRKLQEVSVCLNGSTVTINGPAFTPHSGLYWMLLFTQIAYDADGRENQEAYVCVYLLRGTNQWTPLGQTLDNSAPYIDYRVRAFQLQGIPDYNLSSIANESDLWNALFDPKRLRDKKAAIQEDVLHSGIQPGVLM